MTGICNLLTNTIHETYYVYDNYGNLTYVVPPLVDKGNLITTQAVTSGYDDFYKSIDQSVFTGASGGGSVRVTISNNVLTVVFSAGFNSSMLSSTPHDLLTTPCLLPDIFLGYVGASQSYSVSITNGKLQITNRMGMRITTFSETFTFPLPSSCSTTVASANKTVLDNLCYQYKYDEYNRVVEKKIPGKDWEYIVYDKMDRPIMTQDINLRGQNKWLFNKYDAFGRVVYTGDYKNTLETTRIAIQGLVDASTTLWETKLTTSSPINGTTVYYTNVAFPNINNVNINLFTINYYDKYDFDLNGGDLSISYGKTPITNVKCLGTGNKVRILETSNWITTVNYYDDKARPIYSYSKNDFLQTTSNVKTNFDFAGKVLETTTTHSKTGAITNLEIVDQFTYDHAGRLTKQTQAINGTQTPEVIVENSYDELGQLYQKKVGGKTTQSRLQTIDYTYNIRGWLKGINDINGLGSYLFAFKINYSDIADISKKLYNGNISQTLWRTNNSDSNIKDYIYNYDTLNRLTSAVSQDNGRYNESLSYDKNGNIVTLVRNGYKDANATQLGTMDNLVYTYDGGNKLFKVKDTSGSTEGFKDGIDSAQEYNYDSNGNMKTDGNKGITAITYNHLNLPTSVTIAGGSINYYYDATGVKQRKVFSTITTDYANGFQYEKIGSGEFGLKFFPITEGYVNSNNGIYTYIYQYKDHLGNVRLSYSDKDNNGIINKSTEIVEANHYYPFGLKQKVAGEVMPQTNYKYKYNGKELQDELGLNMYDYGARNYDPALGRWLNIDPLAETSRRFSPYAYALNNPIYFIDPDGMTASEGWIKQDNWGSDPTYKYDANVNTVDDAISAGYGGLPEVYQHVSITASDNSYDISLNSDGTVTNNGDGSNVSMQSTRQYENGNVGGATELASGTKIYSSATSGPIPPIATGACTPMDFSSPVFLGAGLLQGAWALGGTTSTSMGTNSVSAIESSSPNFVVTKSGQAIPIPEGAVGPTAPMRGSGMVYQGGSGGSGMSANTTGVRIMDANANQGARVNYMNNASPTAQTVNPATGRVISNSDPAGHIPIKN